VDNTPAVIFKSPDHGYWAQHQIADHEGFWAPVEVDEDGAAVDGRYTITFPVSALEANFPGVLAGADPVAGTSGAAGTAERGVIITNWDTGFVIESFVIENALALQIPIGDFEDISDGEGQFLYQFAQYVAPYSTIQVVFTPEEIVDVPTTDLFTMVLQEPENWWFSREADELIGFSDTQYIATFYAANFESVHPGTFARTAGTDANATILTNWSGATVINDITVINPLVP
jgi:hypothetical protein